MSWFLKQNKKLLLLLFGLLSIVLFFTKLWFMSIVIIVVEVSYVFLVFNRIVASKIGNISNIKLFSSQREIQEYETLVIGDSCDSSIYKDFIAGNCIEMKMYGRSLEASYQILLHTFSILNSEVKKCIIIDSGIQFGYTIFDIQYFSMITKKELGLENLNNKLTYPLIYEPIRSLKVILGISYFKYDILSCSDLKIKRFCEDKKIELIYLGKR